MVVVAMALVLRSLTQVEIIGALSFVVKVEGWHEGFTVNVARRSEGLVVDIEFAVDGGGMGCYRY